MQFEVDHIRQLVMEELAGTISEEDAALLQQIVAESVEAWVLYTRLREELDTSEMHKALAALDYSLPAGNVLEIAKRTKRRRHALQVASVVILLIIAAGISIVLVRKPQQGLLVNISQQHVELQLPNGKVVDLSTEKQQLQVGGIILNSLQNSLRYSSQTNVAPAGWAILNVPAGRDYKIQLSDGTEIWLNSATTLQFPFNFSERTRDVRINGEAYLKVAKNTERPFIVHLPHSTVKVLGTAFNVNTYDSGRVRVSLVEGSIKMQAQNEAQVLKPGYEISYQPKKGMQIATFEESSVLSWQKGIYFFDDVALEEVCQISPRWYGVKVIMDNREVARRHFTGSFVKNKPVQISLDHLKATNLIDYYFDKDSILHIK